MDCLRGCKPTLITVKGRVSQNIIPFDDVTDDDDDFGYYHHYHHLHDVVDGEGGVREG